jgi:NAD-dependent DNA ligase
MTRLRRLLCALGLRRFCAGTAARPDRSHDEMERVRERQRQIAARVEALGVRVDVARRPGEGTERRRDGTVPR